MTDIKTAIDREQILQTLREESSYLHDKYGILRLALYGSFAQETSTESSDIDLLVELSRLMGLEFVALAEHLETILGRKVDLATFDTLRRSLENPRHRSTALNIQRTLTDG
jgi:predicted nucleotidyltransferase